MEDISTKFNGMVIPNSIPSEYKSKENMIQNSKSDTSKTEKMNRASGSNNAQNTSVNTVLVTANVGSVFEDTDRLMPIWLEQFDAFLERTKAEFVAIHCQEVQMIKVKITSS